MELLPRRFFDMPARDTHAGRLLKFYDLYSIDRDAKAKQAKHDGSGSSRARTLGGRSLWGGLLDVACAKYGWTLDYVLWGISYLNLTMMLLDAITVDYDAEPQIDNDIINADDPANRDRLNHVLYE